MTDNGTYNHLNEEVKWHSLNHCNSRCYGGTLGPHIPDIH